jgi:serine protease SohB
MHALAELGLFAAKALLVVVAIAFVIGAIARAARRGAAGESPGSLRVRKLNDGWRRSKLFIQAALLPKPAVKRLRKEAKREVKAGPPPDRARVWVLDFEGTLRAPQTEGLREEVTAVLGVARRGEEVVVRLKSSGGLVHAYGFGASQLARLRDAGLKVTVAVDQIAASGGYLMAAVGDQILAAPFAIVGSIGVVAGFPNFNRFLKGRDVDFELITAGKYKRTLTMFGENTDEARQKFQEDLDATHDLFKGFVARWRPAVDIDKVSTGEHWYGEQALELGLVDRLTTSDDYLFGLREAADVFHVRWVPERRLLERLSATVEGAVARGVERVWERSEEQRYL